MLAIGIRGSRETAVTPENTANAYASGALEVFATPAMIALIEQTAWTSVAPELAEGESTVGTELNIRHLAPTPVGGTVRCETELIAIDRRKLTFRAEVFDGNGKVGEGTHERFIVDAARFMEKAEQRRGGN